MRLATKYPNHTLYAATVESNLIEREPTTGESFDRHWRGTLLARTAAEEGTILHPRVLAQILWDGHANGDRYRMMDVYVNQEDEQRHVFPPYQSVQGMMNAWWFNLKDAHIFGRQNLNDPMERFHFHAWFEAIHPFIDGNGRVGRMLLWNLDMLTEGLLHRIDYEFRNEYYDALEDWRKAHSALTLEVGEHAGATGV